MPIKKGQETFEGYNKPNKLDSQGLSPLQSLTLRRSRAQATSGTPLRGQGERTNSDGDPRLCARGAHHCALEQSLGTSRGTAGGHRATSCPLSTKS